MLQEEYRAITDIINKHCDTPIYKSYELLKCMVALCDIVIEQDVNDYDGNISLMRSYFNKKAILCENNIEMLKGREQNVNKI